MTFGNGVILSPLDNEWDTLMYSHRYRKGPRKYRQPQIMKTDDLHDGDNLAKKATGHSSLARDI